MAKSFEYHITFDVEYNAKVLNSIMKGFDYSSIYSRIDWESDAPRYEISNYYYNNPNEFELDIKRILSSIQDVDPKMSIECNAVIDDFDGSVDLQFDNVNDENLVEQVIEKIMKFLEEYTITVKYDEDDSELGEPLAILVAATGVNKEFLKLDKMIDKVFDTWEKYDVDVAHFYDSSNTAALVISEGNLSRQSLMEALEVAQDHFEISDEAKKELTQKYDEFFSLFEKAQATFPGIRYDADSYCFVAPANTAFNVFLDEIEVEEG